MANTNPKTQLRAYLYAGPPVIVLSLIGAAWLFQDFQASSIRETLLLLGLLVLVTIPGFIAGYQILHAKVNDVQRYERIRISAHNQSMLSVFAKYIVLTGVILGTGYFGLRAILMGHSVTIGAVLLGVAVAAIVVMTPISRHTFTKLDFSTFFDRDG